MKLHKKENIKTYEVTEFFREGLTCRKYFFPEGEHILTYPIELGSFDIVEGASSAATLIKVEGSFEGPFIKSRDLRQHCDQLTWFADDGVPVRFSISNITIDLENWMPIQGAYSFDYGNLSQCAIGLYGKAFRIHKVCLKNCPGSGLISIGPNQGGKRDFYLDSPEARIEDLEVINTRDDSVVFAGPHDSILNDIVVSLSKKRGVYIVGDKYVNGACDIGFIHAYATDYIAIDVQAKVKARFLQGDTGCYAGVAIGNNNKSVIELIESYKTRSKDITVEAYGVIIQSVETQIGMVRIRADAGADGLYLGGAGNVIGNLHICAGSAHSGFMDLEKPPTAIVLSGHANTIVYGRIIDVSSQPIIVKKDGLEKYFTGHFSMDLSKLPALAPVLSIDNFDQSLITINNKQFSN